MLGQKTERPSWPHLAPSKQAQLSRRPLPAPVDHWSRSREVYAAS